MTQRTAEEEREVIVEWLREQEGACEAAGDQGHEPSDSWARASAYRDAADAIARSEHLGGRS